MADIDTRTPSELGFRMPAEWEPHEATWFSWPHNLETWPEELPQVERALAGIVGAIAEGEAVYINVLDRAHQQHVANILREEAALERVRFFEIPTDDAWARDHGPLFLVRDRSGRREVVATSWRFNSWGEKYPPWENDDRASTRMADAIGAYRFEQDVVLEGGSIEVNGTGTLITTESCLLNSNRNPGLTRGEIETLLETRLGVRHIIWLGDGIRGDDTDGHIDDLTRFVSEDTVVTVVSTDIHDPDYDVLQENLERLQDARLADGRPLHVVPLPTPLPVFIRGDRMPASYANFYIANRTVVVPTFEDEADSRALVALQQLFPERTVVSLDCRELIWGLGAIHCLTQQVPAGTMITSPH